MPVPTTIYVPSSSVQQLRDRSSKGSGRGTSPNHIHRVAQRLHKTLSIFKKRESSGEAPLDDWVMDGKEHFESEESSSSENSPGARAVYCGMGEGGYNLEEEAEDFLALLGKHRSVQCRSK